MQPERDYSVGYGKPPEHTRFKKGHSGNGQGRPRGVKNLATLLGAALDEKVIVTENGRRRKITKREAIIPSSLTARPRPTSRRRRSSSA